MYVLRTRMTKWNSVIRNKKNKNYTNRNRKPAFLNLKYDVILLFKVNAKGLPDKDDKLNMCILFCSFLNLQLNFIKLILFLQAQLHEQRMG